VHELHTLIEAAQEAGTRAYAPYSHYHVGAALRALDGTVFQGCNVESAVYPAGICAERTALVKAVSEGVREFDALAVVTRDGGSPCGICRQLLYEFSPQLRVVLARADGEVVYDGKLNELLPLGFTATSLRAE
jgi:cytidine deaminase